MPSQLLAVKYVHHNVDPSDPAAYGACHLFPLDKNPDVRTIGVNEVLRRIIWKAVMRILVDRTYTRLSVLPNCVLVRLGCEAAVHAMK